MRAQITCLGVYKWNGDVNEPACLGAAQDLTSFGYFQRSTVKEMLLFVSRTIVKRTQPGQRQSVEHNGAHLGQKQRAEPWGAQQTESSGECALPRSLRRRGQRACSQTLTRPGLDGRGACPSTRPEYIAHVANRGGLATIMFADREYPVRAAFGVLQQVGALCARPPTVRPSPPGAWRVPHCGGVVCGSAGCCCALTPRRLFCHAQQLTDDVVARLGERWRNAAGDSAECEDLVTSSLSKFQDPAAADKLLKIQRELDETKIVLHKTIDSVLARGEKLDNLVEKSSDLSMASQMFYKQARKSNSCCSGIM